MVMRSHAQQFTDSQCQTDLQNLHLDLKLDLKLDILSRKAREVPQELLIEEECQTDLDFEKLEDELDELDQLREQDRIRQEEAAIKSAQKSSRGDSKKKKRVNSSRQGSFALKKVSNKLKSTIQSKGSLQVPGEE